MKDKSWYWLIGGVIFLVVINVVLASFLYSKGKLSLRRFGEIKSYFVLPNKERGEKLIKDYEQSKMVKENSKGDIPEITCVDNVSKSIYKVGDIVSDKNCVVCECAPAGVITCKNGKNCQ